MRLTDLLHLNWQDLWHRLTHGLDVKIPAKRWALSVDDEGFGSVVLHHEVGVDADGAWAKWVFEYDNDHDAESPKIRETLQSWVTPNKQHIIRLNDEEMENPSVRVRVTTVGFPPKGVLIVIHRFIDAKGNPRAYRFDGKL